MFSFLSSKESTKDTIKEKKTGLFTRLKKGLQKTRNQLSYQLSKVIFSKKNIDIDLLEEIETLLITSDIGALAAKQMIDDLSASIKKRTDTIMIWQMIQKQLHSLLKPCEQPLIINNSHKPFVILMVGVNGVGKTTTIGKLAKRLQQEGKKIMLAAGDTFRAAAVEQLQAWGEKNDIPVIAQQQGADSAAVIYDAFQSARARRIDVLIVDTAGRLHTKENLMQELKKIKNVLTKLDESAPHEIMLVLDANTGQNALNQAEQFHKSIQLTGITLTKLDGTAKGGIIFAIAKKLGLPIRFIGVGEGSDDLHSFTAQEFIAALFMKQNSEE